MKSLKLAALLALTLPLPAFAGGNVLNGPKNCQSLGGEASDDTGKHTEKLSRLCDNFYMGTASEADLRELRDAGFDADDKFGK
jgi:hypothetical protein